MNEIALDNIKKICCKYPNISISIHEWWSMIANTQMWGAVDVVTIKDVLMTGHYGTLFNCKIFVSKATSQGCFRVSEKNYPMNPSKKLEDWSPEMNLEWNIDKLERYLSLPAFW